MKVQVRRSVFETNSSSTHSLSICSAKEYDDWCKGLKVYDYYNDQLIPIDALTEEQKNAIDDEDEGEFFSRDGYFNCIGMDYETFRYNKILESGEDVVVFGHYGYC